MRRKLSASGISCFLESPKQFYWRYIYQGGLEPIGQSVADFAHDRILGSIWSEAVDRFYKGVPEKENTSQSLKDWKEQTDGWVPPRTQERYTAALENWLTVYHQEFSPKDGVRNGSEKRVENDRFVGYLDGLSADHKTIHECKSTSRARNLSEQLLKYQTSLQIKLYAVMTQAEGVVIEIAFKDEPFGIYRAPVYKFSKEQVDGWEQGFNKIADYIDSLDDDPNNYLCCADQCSIITKNFTSVCNYQSLCLGIEGAEIFFKAKENRRK